MMLSLGAFGMVAAILHLLIHGVSKALLFLGAGSVTHGTGRTDIREMGGLWRSMPVTAITFTIGAASLAGVVPFSGILQQGGGARYCPRRAGSGVLHTHLRGGPPERALHGEGDIPGLLRR